MARKIKYIVTIKMKWWFKHLYLPGLIFINWLVVDLMNIEAEPNQDKMNKIIKKGINFHVSH